MTIEPGVTLANWCTLDVGGPARWFCHARDERTVAEALQWAVDRRHPVLILGGGSNLVCADRGYDGLVVHVDIPGVTIERTGDAALVTAGAGERWDPLVARVVDLGLGGFECLSGIPGRVGGTPIQNVGAYGQDVSSTIRRVRTFDRRRGEFVELANEACGFGYRTSRFKQEDRDRFVVTRVVFSLAAAPPTLTYADVREHFARAGRTAPSLSEVREAVLSIRRRKGMVIEANTREPQSVGSFFVNPVIPAGRFDELRAVYAAMPHYRVGGDAVKVPAAWLIEQAGFPRGTRDGAVGVSPLQAQAIVNFGGATAHAVVALAAAIKHAVWRRFRIALIPEPVFVGFEPNPALNWLLETALDGE